MERIWSSKQVNIFSWFVAITLDVVEHLIVRARAGTGKTTTIVEAVKRAVVAVPQLRVIVCAFNKNIERELSARLAGTSVTVKTLHAIGLACVKRFWSDVRVNFSGEREADLAERVCGVRVPDAIKKLVGKLCTKAREMAPHANRPADLFDIAIEFECEPDEQWSAEGFDLTFVCTKALEACDLAASEKPKRTGIDGSDMIFLPVRNGWLHKSYDLVVVDEAQDMTTTQLEIARGICSGRIVVVGDDKQAIYGFRGADSESLDRLKLELNATEMPLNTTYRCAKAIVREAQNLVPDFEAGENNPEGAIEQLPMDKLVDAAAAGDFVLSRINAPLVSIAMSLLRNGKRARIAGRDIGKGLIALVRKLKARSIPDLLEKISNWEKRETSRLEKRYANKTQSATYQMRLDAIHDQAEMLASLTDNARNVDEVTSRIEALFTDDGLGQAGIITCSSVHKAKGLEADRVFVLSATLRETSQEERNIAYVAVTRAKSTLVYVH